MSVLCRTVSVACGYAPLVCVRVFVNVPVCACVFVCLTALLIGPALRDQLLPDEAARPTTYFRLRFGTPSSCAFVCVCVCVRVSKRNGGVGWGLLCFQSASDANSRCGQLRVFCIFAIKIDDPNQRACGQRAPTCENMSCVGVFTVPFRNIMGRLKT